jgi:hypothetical protein
MQITFSLPPTKYSDASCRIDGGAPAESCESSYFTSPIVFLRRSVTVPVDELHSLRMVIQQIGVEKPSYRVIAYGDWQKPRHSDFASAQGLLETLKAVVPNFALSELLLNPLEADRGSIVFAGEIILSTSQLSGLGLH